MVQKGTTEVAKEDLLAAWTVLENLAVSLDQIGGVFGHAEGSGHGPRDVGAGRRAERTRPTSCGRLWHLRCPRWRARPAIAGSMSPLNGS